MPNLSIRGGSDLRGAELVGELLDCDGGLLLGVAVLADGENQGQLGLP